MEEERGTAVGKHHGHETGHEQGEAKNHDQERGHDLGKDPAEQEALARALGEELTDIFARYVRGEVDFADLTFLAYETIQDLHVIASGEYEVEYEDDEVAGSAPAGEVSAADPDDAGYDQAEATEQQEELAQEPAG